MTALHTHHALLRYYAAHETPSSFERLRWPLDRALYIESIARWQRVIEAQAGKVAAYKRKAARRRGHNLLALRETYALPLGITRHAQNEIERLSAELAALEERIKAHV